MTDGAKPRSNLVLFSQLAVLNLAWAPVNLMVRYAKIGGFSPSGIGVVRWVSVAIGVLALLSVPRFRQMVGLKWPTLKQACWAAFFGLIFIGPAHLIYYVTLSNVPTTEGAVLNATAPFWVAMLAGAVLRERIGQRTWMALALGGLGTYVVTVGFGLPDFRSTGGHLGPSLLYLLGILLESLGGTFATYIVRRSSGIGVFAFETMGVAVAASLAPLIFPTALPLAVPHLGASWLPLAYLVFGAGILTFGGWYVIVERSPLSLMVVSIALQPPVAAILGYVYLHEVLTTQTLIGSAMVLAALVLAATEKPAPVAAT